MFPSNASKYTALSALLIIVIVLFLQVHLIWGETNDTVSPFVMNQQKLRSFLMKDYHKELRPAKNQSIATNVDMRFDVQYIVSLDEKTQILTVKGILTMKWTDEHLVWKPDDYGGVKTVRFTSRDIWIPDIHSIYNVKAEQAFQKDGSTAVEIFSNGSVRWFPPAVYDVPCSTRFRHYPFDEHNCTLLFGAWSHSGREIILKAIIKPFKQYGQQTTEWILQNVTHETNLISQYNLYYMVKVVVFLQRSSRIYRYICVVPTLTALVTTLSGFWLLPCESSRFMIGCSNVIMLSLLLQHMAVTIPAGKEIPLIAQYSAACLCMSAAFLIVTVVVHLVSQSSGSPPHGLVRRSRQSLDRLLCLSTFSTASSDNKAQAMAESLNQNTVTSFEEVQRTKDWTLIALVFDRSAFWMFVVVYAILVSVLAAV